MRPLCEPGETVRKKRGPTRSPPLAERSQLRTWQQPSLIPSCPSSEPSVKPDKQNTVKTPTHLGHSRKSQGNNNSKQRNSARHILPSPTSSACGLYAEKIATCVSRALCAAAPHHGLCWECRVREGVSASEAHSRGGDSAFRHTHHTSCSTHQYCHTLTMPPAVLRSSEWMASHRLEYLSCATCVEATALRCGKRVLWGCSGALKGCAEMTGRSVERRGGK